MVFAETHRRVADGADRAALQVGAAVHIVQHAAGLRVHQQAVDGEIAAQYVLARFLLEVHAGGAAAVAVIVIAAKWGHFHLREVVAHQHHSEKRAHLAGVRKEAHNAIRTGVGRNVEILGFRAQKQVAYASAHQVRLVA